MHIHGNSMAINPANPYSAAQGMRAEAAQRATETRKKLLRKSGEIEGAASPQEDALVGYWMDGLHGQVRGEDSYHSNTGGGNPELD